MFGAVFVLLILPLLIVTTSVVVHFLSKDTGGTE
jgi:hypothetical protein